MPSHKIESIQALRFVFCMLIFSFHFRGMMIKTDVFTYGGDAGVSFFFILSGFVLCLGSGKRVEDGSLKLLPFLRSRLQKLYPLHFAAMLIAVSFNVYLGEGFRPGAFVAQLFLVQSWFLSRSILLYGNGVSWFLGPLFLCYALFPWLYRNIVERRPRAGFIAIVTVYLVCYSSVSLVSDQVIDDCLNGFPPLRIADFAVGMLAYSVWRSDKAQNLRQRLLAMSAMRLTLYDLLCVAVVVATYFAYLHLPSWFRFSMLYWVPFPVIICYFALTDGGKGLVGRIFSLRPVQYLGNISFEIYMLHIIALTIAAFIYGHVIGYDDIFMPALVVFSLFVTVVMASVARQLEQRYYKRIKR